jgi:hypothetical protein
MKVLNLRCANGHVFEGWFGSDEDFMDQNGRGLVECPLCADQVITRLPSAPRLNLSGAREPEAPAAPARPSQPAQPQSLQPSQPSQPARPPQPADLQAAWLHAVRELMARTEDVGTRFAEEARRIHYGETPERGIRGQASAEERAALLDEGIETFALPVPRALDGPVQ